MIYRCFIEWVYRKIQVIFERTNTENIFERVIDIQVTAFIKSIRLHFR